jgi:hypothetical protein
MSAIVIPPKASIDPAFHAREAMEAASLGKSIVGEINNYLVALLDLSKVDALQDKELRSRCAVIKGLAVMAVRFAEEMDGLMECVHRDHKEALSAVSMEQKVGM